MDSLYCHDAALLHCNTSLFVREQCVTGKQTEIEELCLSLFDIEGVCETTPSVCVMKTLENMGVAYLVPC